MSRVVPPKGARDGQLMAGESLLVRLANFVKLPHTVFAMPFALVGVLCASVTAPVTIARVGWVLLAFTAARFAGMGFNRISFGVQDFDPAVQQAIHRVQSYESVRDLIVAARRLGFETEVIEAACRSIDLDGSADAARKSFQEHGIALA